MLTPEVRILFRKEWRQLLRSRAAVLTALILPVLFLLVVPAAQILGAQQMDPEELPKGTWLPPGLAHIGQDPKAMVRFLMPLFVSLGALIVPMVSASYTLVAEREARTLELLVALPVSIGQVIAAKLAALLVLTVVITLPLFAVDTVLLLVTGVGGPGFVLALAVLLISALGYSTAGALVISLLARDFRTANNLNGLLVVPAIFLTMGLMAALPSASLAAVLTAAALGAAGVLCGWVSIRVVTFERFLR